VYVGQTACGEKVWEPDLLVWTISFLPHQIVILLQYVLTCPTYFCSILILIIRGIPLQKVSDIMMNLCNSVDFGINSLISARARARVCVPLGLIITTPRFAHTLYFRNDNNYFLCRFRLLVYLMEAHCVLCEERTEVLCIT